MVDFFLGSPNGKQVGAMHSALIETMNYSSTQNPTTILKFFEKISMILSQL